MLMMMTMIMGYGHDVGDDGDDDEEDVVVDDDDDDDYDVDGDDDYDDSDGDGCHDQDGVCWLPLMITIDFGGHGDGGDSQDGNDDEPTPSIIMPRTSSDRTMATRPHLLNQLVWGSEDATASNSSLPTLTPL